MVIDCAAICFFLLHICVLCFYLCVFPSATRPPERRHGYEQQFVTSVTPQPEHESLEPKRPRVDGPSETHFSRAPTGTIVLPLPHVMQDGIRPAGGEVKKVRHNCQSWLALLVLAINTLFKRISLMFQFRDPSSPCEGILSSQSEMMG